MGIDVLVVGAGFSGAVVAERMATKGYRVMVIDKRPHIGGNSMDFDWGGVRVHIYGPHIFHTRDEEVWKYLSRFTGWFHYKHRVLVEVDGEQIELPVNLKGIERFFGEEGVKVLIDAYGEGTRKTVFDLLQSENEMIKEMGRWIYQNIFLGYNLKQWGKRPEDIDISVIARVPVKISYDPWYFNDKYQGIPAQGYETLFKNLLSHPGIKLKLLTDFREIKEKADLVIYTGPIDEYFNYSEGKLPWRSMRFSFKRSEVRQSVAVINYPSTHEYLRTTDFSHFQDKLTDFTFIGRDFPESDGPPFYPVLTAKSLEILSKYKNLAEGEKHTVFLGRLGRFKYINMDQAVKEALELAKTLP